MIASILEKQILPWIAYPGVMAAGLVLQYVLLEMNLSLTLSSFIPVIVGVLFISLLEFMIPYRRSWRPSFSEIKTDFSYTLFVQILLPRLLGFLAAISLLETLTENQVALLSLWPDHWSLPAQVILMLVSAEFLRYWLHRAAHNWSPLWRLHAVHHSPDKLYWLNTSRFHPLEKAIQFLFEAMPFILLGVSAEVLAVYFVCYAINGFFQHSNINLKFGVLNYLISSAELHRWHHVRDIKESGTNFGNNLIIWDLVFGSWYLPKDKSAEQLGLINSAYPMSFIDQMKTPFTPGLDKSQTVLLGLADVYRNLRVQTGIAYARVFYYLPFKWSLSNPMKHQQRLLKKIISENSATQYGKEHGFSAINSYRSYTQAVPIQEYESLGNYIAQQEQTKQPCLTKDQPVFYALTSGTTGRPKHIPVLQQTIKQHHRALAIFACVQNKATHHGFGGRLLAIPGAYHEGKLEGGSIYGSISGLLYFLMPNYLQNKYVAPNEVFAIADHELKYRLILRLAIQHVNLSYMVTANPSTFLKLIDIINSDMDSLASDIRTGSFSGSDKLPQTVRQAIQQYLLADPIRAQALMELKALGRCINYADIWPGLKLVVTWVGGGCGTAIATLKTLLSEKTHIIELGYLASELRGTITLENTDSAGVPTLHDNFFEFIEVERYQTEVETVLTLDQLEQGKQYFVVITTPAGLYRYFMNDVITVTGFRNKTPLIKFVQKGKGVTNITGEKLTEQQLIMAIDKVNQGHGVTLPFYIALAATNDFRYELYVEATIEPNAYGVAIDQTLQELNAEYASKRASGRLKPIIVRRIKNGTGALYKDYVVAQGQRESQFKALLLQNKSDCHFQFEDYIADVE